MTLRPLRRATYALIGASLLWACSGGDDYTRSPNLSDVSFRYEEIDSAGPNAPWGKSIGDLNGDGLTDVVVGGHRAPKLSIQQRILRKIGAVSYTEQRGELVWYESPMFNKHLISLDFNIRTDIEVGDMDGDGMLDVVATTDEGIGWFHNPDWNFAIVDSRRFHDIELSDFDEDGQLELIGRNQSLFGYRDGNAIHLFDRLADGTWASTLLDAPHGEGLLVSDIDGDKRPDIVVNKIGYLNKKGGHAAVVWHLFQYSTDPIWENVFVSTGDFNGDSRKDIVLSPAEPKGARSRISWFMAPRSIMHEWHEIVITPNVESVHHFVGVADFDLDGWDDVATAAMNQGTDPDEIAVFLNSDEGRAWRKIVLGESGSHSMRIFDANGDFYPDLFGANWQIDDYDGDYPIQLWLNNMGEGSKWKRHVIDDNRPGQATFVFAEDLDSDGLIDITTGAWWYKNPGKIGTIWTRRPIGDGANNVAFVHDFDEDGHPDILASGWRGYLPPPSLMQRFQHLVGLNTYDYGNPGNEFVWARNEGGGIFQIYRNIESAAGDFLQGTDILADGEHVHVLLSWHNDQTSLQALTVPKNALTERWKWSEISSHSDHEAISANDIDDDGQIDILLGTRLLKYVESTQSWQIQNIIDSEERPDRHVLSDINGDGRMDIVVGYEAVSKPGKVAWYEPVDPDRSIWKEHVIAYLIGPMSLSVSDVDRDGDADIIVGEHNLNYPERARLVWYENRDSEGTRWAPRLIYTGDEHHDGALDVDIDGDGDVDIVSIGWSHNRIILYENTT